MADIDFRFEGTTYHLAGLTAKGRNWLEAEGLAEIVATVGINKIRERAVHAGLETLVNGNAYKPGYRLQESRHDPYQNRMILLEIHKRMDERRAQEFRRLERRK